MNQWVKDFVHNCIVHLMLPFLPRKFGDRLHDRNAAWAFGVKNVDQFRKAGQ